VKIIHLILGKANPERMNGVNKVVHALATQQHRAGADVAVWGITTDLAENYPARTFATRLFKARRNPFALPPALAAALAELAAAPAAVVHLHGAFIPVYYAVARRLTALGVPYILTPHGSYSPAALQKSRVTKLVYKHLFENYLLRHSARVHCLGLSEVVGVQHLDHRLRTNLLPYGFEPPQPVVPLFPARPGRFRVGFCGRLDDHHKGLDCLLEGFAEFARHVPAAELWIIGDGPDRPLVEYWADEAPEGSVKLLGSRFDDEKIALLGQLSVFAHTSHYEGLPTAVLEAVALGVPCVVTEATNLGSYVREFGCGEVLATASPALLTDALHRLYDQWAAPAGATTEAEAMDQRCRRMVRTAFDWPRLLPAYNQMYQEALAA
jgi:glycosyltransferase involved in cell wall biosynthesis